MTKLKLQLGDLNGEEGNAFVMLGRARKALNDAGRFDDWEKINVDARSGDYEHLIKVLEENFDLEYTR